MKKQALLLLAAALLGLWPAPARAVSSYTQCLTLQQPATGDQTNSWGATVDTNWSIVDDALAALETLNLPAQTGYPTIALSFSQGVTDQAKYSRFSFTGALTAATTVLWPSGRCGRFVAQNGTTGAFGTTLCVNNGSGACAGGSVVVPQGQTEALYSDGTNIVPDTNAIGGGLTVNGNLSTTGILSATGAATLSGGLSVTGAMTLGTALTVPYGGTGATSLTAHGVLVGEGTGAVAPTAVGTAGQVLTSNGSGADPTFQAPSFIKTAPQVTVYTSGSGSYTTPSGALYLVVELVGGGGGGGGSGASGTAGFGNAGTATTFGSSLLVGGGGSGGSAGSGGSQSTGGTATGGDINVAGGYGGMGNSSLANQYGGLGAASPYGAGGPPGTGSGGTSNSGTSAVAPGAGGGGAGPGGSGWPGGGGAAGGWLRKLISSPAASYAYVVGAGGTGGTAGTTGAGGGNGEAGLIVVTAYFE